MQWTQSSHLLLLLISLSCGDSFDCSEKVHHARHEKAMFSRIVNTTRFFLLLYSSIPNCTMTLPVHPRLFFLVIMDKISGYVTMRDLVVLIRDLVEHLQSKKIGRLFRAGRVIVFEIGSHQIAIPMGWLSREVISKIKNRYYSPIVPTRGLKMLRTISQMIDEITDFDLINIDIRIDSVRKKLKKPSRPDAFSDNPPGVVHFKYRQEKRKFLFLSQYRANTVCQHEIPLIARLERCWSFGKIFPSFCLVEEKRNAWHRIFEIDAVSFCNGDLFMFELKHSKYSDEFKILEHLLSAGRKIQIWREKMNLPIRKIIPIVYLRKKSDLAPQYLNIIFFEDLHESFTAHHLSNFIAYPIDKDISKVKLDGMAIEIAES